jgi:predicted lipid-binding transport protein (Tim44 family)
MVRTLVGYAILAVVGVLALKLVFGLVGIAISLLMSLVWLAAIGFVIYLVLKVISPRTARRVRDAIRGEPDPGSPS